MFDMAQKPLHNKTKVFQPDANGRIMMLKSQYSLSRDTFDGLLTVNFRMITFYQRACTRHKNSFMNAT
jgi:hypothetical protein